MLGGHGDEGPTDGDGMVMSLVGVKVKKMVGLS